MSPGKISFTFTVMRIGGLFPSPPPGGLLPPPSSAAAGATFAAAGYSSSPSGTSSKAFTSKSCGISGLTFIFLTSTVRAVASSSPLSSLSLSSRILAASLGSKSSNASSAVFPYFRTISASAIACASPRGIPSPSCSYLSARSSSSFSIALTSSFASPSVAVPGLRSDATGSSATGAFPSGKSPACSEIRFSFPKAAQRSL